MFVDLFFSSCTEVAQQSLEHPQSTIVDSLKGCPGSQSEYDCSKVFSRVETLTEYRLGHNYFVSKTPSL